MKSQWRMEILLVPTSNKHMVGEVWGSSFKHGIDDHYKLWNWRLNRFKINRFTPSDNSPTPDVSFGERPGHAGKSLSRRISIEPSSLLTLPDHRYNTLSRQCVVERSSRIRWLLKPTKRLACGVKAILNKIRLSFDRIWFTRWNQASLLREVPSRTG